MGPIYMCHLLPRVTAQGAPVKLRMQAQLQAGACREVFFQELGDTRETKIKEDIFVIYLSLSLLIQYCVCLGIWVIKIQDVCDTNMPNIAKKLFVETVTV